ncbi:MAG: hypothetical protein JRE23_15745 [Deltaproteobacteria bacterium]|nr:hypothetical protein [Deltaproteobacteria bacterium]
MEGKLVEVKVCKTIMHRNKIYVAGETFSVEGGLATALVSSGLVELRDVLEVDAELIEVDGLKILELAEDIEAVLLNAELDTIEKIQKATKSELVKLPKIGEATAKSIKAKADEFIVGE